MTIETATSIDAPTAGVTETTEPAVAEAARTAWTAWRAVRAAGLRADHGVLSLTAHHWLGAEPAALPGLPGVWWADTDGAHVRVDAPTGGAATATLLDAATRRPVEGVRHVTVAEAGSAVPFWVGGPSVGGPLDPGPVDDAAVGVELALRTGRYLLRTRDPQAPALVAFLAAGGDAVLPAYDFDPAQDREVPVRWYAEPRAAVVDGAKPGLVHHVQVVGHVELAGGPVAGPTVARLVAGHQGGVTLSFTDRAEDAPEWRAVHVSDADVEASRATAEQHPDGSWTGTLRVDLNRATAYPSHFNDHGTCPRPLVGNDLPFAVEAGEKDPR